MIIITIFISILIIGIIIHDRTDLDILGMILTMISGFILFICLLTIPILNMKIKGDIIKYHALEATIKVARSGVASQIERAAMMHDVIGSNMALAEYKYWNETAFDIWIPDAVMDLTPLK